MPKTVKTVLRAKPIPKGGEEVQGVVVAFVLGAAVGFWFDPVPIALSGGTLVIELDTEKGEARLIHVSKREAA